MVSHIYSNNPIYYASSTNLVIFRGESWKYMEVHPCNELSARKGDIMYVLTLPIKTNQFIFGNDKLSRLIISFIASKRVVFSDKETGDLFEKFLTETKTAKMFW